MRGALAGAAVGGLMLGVVPASPAAAAAPTAILEPLRPPCADDFFPYDRTLRVVGFPPNERIHLLIVQYKSDHNSSYYYKAYGTPTGPFGFMTDANGAWGIEIMAGFDGPWRLGTLFFRDRDGSNTYTSGDGVVANLITVIDQHCTTAVSQPK